MIGELNQRSRDIFRHIVEAYVATGEPVGSRTISRRLGLGLSSATIRNVMADLEEVGLLMAPHTSAGRVPTEAGLQLFVNGLLEVGTLSSEERISIDAQCAAKGRSLAEVLEEATTMLSGLSACAGLVLAPKTDRPLRHIEFVSLSPGRALVVMVTENGLVENRVVDVPIDVPVSTLTRASNFLNAKILGQTLDEARTLIQREIDDSRVQLDELTKRMVATGLATWSGAQGSTGYLIVRGQARLLEDVTALSDLERIRTLFEVLETRESMVRLLDATGRAEGVQIYVGAQNDLFGLAGCSMIVAPYGDSRDRVIGAIGVIGPTRINYARIIPMVDYTAKVVGRLLA
jgi:heat-inducible transcriptional repressor